MVCKVAYRLEQNAEGFPPIAVEILNAIDLGHEQFQIKNAPFFAEGVSYDDVVRALPTAVPGQYQFETVVQASSFISLSLIIMDDSMDSFLMSLLRGLDCVVEYGEFGAYRVLSVAVPEAANYAALRNQLQILEDKGQISFAELALPKAMSPQAR